MKDVTMIAMDLGRLVKSEDITVEKLLAGAPAGAEYKKISPLCRFAIKRHEFFGNFAAARGIAQKAVGSNLGSTSLDGRSAQVLDLEARLVEVINKKLVDDNRLVEGGIVRNPPGYNPGLYEVKNGKLSELEVKDGECVYNPVGRGKGTYQVEVKGSNVSLEKLGPNTVVANPHGTPGVYVTDKDGNLQQKAEGDYVVVDGDTDFIGSDGKEKHLSAGAYKVVVDGQPP
ncbi:MAG: hypothetical protein LBD33_01575, partial [Puniceicoccales bacterium]|nr:hypothetical protein [Puniceicoccales bacterium]